MSDYIPVEILAEIFKRVPVKSLIRFRSVSKPWKSLIESLEFVNSYHICQTQEPQHRIYVQDRVDGNRVPNVLHLPDGLQFLLALGVLVPTYGLSTSCDLTWEGQVCVGGFVYWLAYDNVKLGDEITSNLIVSFDLKSNEFGEVCLPDRYRLCGLDIERTVLPKSFLLLDVPCYEGKMARDDWVPVRVTLFAAKSYMETILLLDQSNSFVY
ncbi:putative F-box protein [Tanacetum coccineum]